MATGAPPVRPLIAMLVAMGVAGLPSWKMHRFNTEEARRVAAMEVAEALPLLPADPATLAYQGLHHHPACVVGPEDAVSDCGADAPVVLAFPDHARVDEALAAAGGRPVSLAFREAPSPGYRDIRFTPVYDRSLGFPHLRVHRRDDGVPVLADGRPATRPVVDALLEQCRGHELYIHPDDPWTAGELTALCRTDPPYFTSRCTRTAEARACAWDAEIGWHLFCGTGECTVPEALPARAGAGVTLLHRQAVLDCTDGGCVASCSDDPTAGECRVSCAGACTLHCRGLPSSRCSLTCANDGEGCTRLP